MKIFAIKNGAVGNGANVETFQVKEGIKIPAIIVGEEGRGRQRGVLPVQLLPEALEEWTRTGSVRIHSCELGTTKAGKPKLFQKVSSDSSSSHAVCVFRTQFGFRGGSSHSGDVTEVREFDMGTRGVEKVNIYAPFPTTQLLAEGLIAQGDAGRMGSGQQLVAIMPADVIFRTGYSGRLYGAAEEHYYRFDGNNVSAMTSQERDVSEMF